MKKNIFVIGLEDFNLQSLKNLPEASGYEFHSLLDFSEIRGNSKDLMWTEDKSPRPDIAVTDQTENLALDATKLLALCEQRLENFQGSVDAIIGYYDFPVTIMLPILRKKYNMPGPSLESVLKCEHKYWSRIEQQHIIPHHIPFFQTFDPFNDTEIQNLELVYPFWIKPVKSFRSFLAFRINDGNDLESAIHEIRENITYISKPFTDFLEMATLPKNIKQTENRTCIAESLLSGSQCTLEGYVYDNTVTVYGVVDSIRESDRSSFSRYQYPSQLPEDIQQRMISIAESVLTQKGFNNSPFNMEFFYNQTEGQVYLLEINPRISQSHADLFEKVNGKSHHIVAIETALGQNPEYRLKQGEYEMACKFMLRHFENARIKKTPTAEQLKEVETTIPGTRIEILVKPGIMLSDLSIQDSYSYELADIYIGGEDESAILNKYQLVLEMLHFEFEPAQEAFSLGLTVDNELNTSTPRSGQTDTRMQLRYF